MGIELLVGDDEVVRLTLASFTGAEFGRRGKEKSLFCDEGELIAFLVEARKLLRSDTTLSML